MLQLTALWPPFNEASLAVFMCTSPGSKADVVPAGPVIPLLSGVVVQLALQCNKKIRVTPWSNSRKSFTPCGSWDACAANVSRVIQD